MTSLLNGFHPTFEALSAHADRSDVDAAGTRIARHVARCPDCATTLLEIRALGEAARGVELPGAPPGLWARIERAGPAHGERAATAPRETPPPEATAWAASPALRPTTHRATLLPSRRSRRVGVAALAAAAIIVAVLFIPNPWGRLEAGSRVGRWQVAPAWPVAGQRVAVRYTPPADLALEPRLVLVGGGARRFGAMTTGNYRDGLVDSLATLDRGTDGSYGGRFTWPDSTSALVLTLLGRERPARSSVLSPDGPVRRRTVPATLVVSGDAHGRPSLAALTFATTLWPGHEVTAYSPADTLIRYFPSEPIGYASARPRARRRLLDDLVEYFTRGERQYLRFDRRFAAASAISADHEVAMVTFANRIDEPAEASKWARRLAVDHGDDPRALDVYAQLLSAALARPGTVDSVRRALPLADSLWARNGHRLLSTGIVAVAATVGDTTAAYRWMERAVVGGTPGAAMSLGMSPARLLVDPAVRRVLVARYRATVDRSCELPAGRHPEWDSSEAWRRRCAESRAASFAALALVERIGGRPDLALRLADSSLALSDSIGDVCDAPGHRERGNALLALGDRTAAVPELARSLGSPSWQADDRRDSIGRALHDVVAPAVWRAQVDSARAAQARCGDRRQREARARRDSSAAQP